MVGVAGTDPDDEDLPHQAESAGVERDPLMRPTVRVGGVLGERTAGRVYGEHVEYEGFPSQIASDVDTEATARLDEDPAWTRAMPCAQEGGGEGRARVETPRVEQMFDTR